jgi:hypothetical protein
MRTSEIIGVLELVTKTWAKQRKQEERQASAFYRRQDALTRRQKVTLKDAAYDVMKDAYMKASSNGTLPAAARQIMYAARGRILELTGQDHLDDKYFTQRLLPDYMTEYSNATAGWDVVFDARGNLHEPHTGLVLPLGTLQVRQYLQDISSGDTHDVGIHIAGGGFSRTRGPQDRYQAILFIEKEGFLPLFQKVRLAERYDVAIMSTKGLSVTASRALVDRLCGDYKIPLLVLHDFDKAGFSIFGTLSRDTRRYEFENEIKVINLGLGLADVEAFSLASEDVRLKTDPSKNLRENGATSDEIQFLCGGKRVELNAFASGDFVRWIESKLDGLGIEKVVPDDGVLHGAYRQMVARKLVVQRFESVLRNAEEIAKTTEIPADLRDRIVARLEDDRSLPWDDALAAEVKAN